MWRRALLALPLLVLSSGASAEEFEFSGPLRFADQFLLTASTLAVEPLPIEVLETDGWQAEIAVSMGNTFTRSRSLQLALEARTQRLPVTPEFLEQVGRESELGEPLFFIDGETLRTELRLRKGLRKDLEIEIRVPFVDRNGGWMDSLVEKFHSVLNLDQDGRFGVPRDDSSLFLTLGEGLFAAPPGSSLTLADPLVALRSRKPLRRQGRHLVWDLAVKIPLADEDSLAGTGTIDMAAQVQRSSCSMKRCGFAALNLRHLGRWQELGLSSRLVPGAYAGLEQRWRGLSWVVQLMIAGSALHGIEIVDLDAETWQLSLGLHKKLGRAHAITAAVTENVAHFENGPDLTFHLALRRGF